LETGHEYFNGLFLNGLKLNIKENYLTGKQVKQQFISLKINFPFIEIVENVSGGSRALDSCDSLKTSIQIILMNYLTIICII
jgi:hypothetical protein